ncbi:MAG: S41 family peptidase [Parachlamydiaceae bacterium]
MRIANKCRWVVLLYLTLAATLNLTAQELLKTQDVDTIMKQIFTQHVDKKEMTVSILRKSFHIYIDQFDPQRIYLLQSEIASFLDVSDAQIQRFMEQYENGKFPEYEQLNGIIQKAIARARDIRAKLETENVIQFFQENTSQQQSKDDDWSDPDLKRSFATTESMLVTRMKDSLAQFISEEKQRYGAAYVQNRQSQTIHLFEQILREHENQYLFVNENGQPMGQSERDNAFTMHVLKALASSLDAHTTVLNPAEAYDMRLRLEKEIEGIGVALQSTPNGYVIAQLVKDSPAEKSSLIQVNDRLVEIDGTKIGSLPFEKVTGMLRGDKGSKVSLVLERVGGQNEAPKKISVALVREAIPVNEDRVTTKFIEADGGIIGIVKLDTFYQSENGVTSEEDVRNAIHLLDQKGNLRGLILDLRENSGGFLSQAVKVAGLFITNGVVVVSKYFNGEEHFYRDMDGKTSYNGPLIILTSKATASAAEIVAQALQDYGVAIIVGDEHTYGKGTIQSQTVTENKASTFFKVTVGKYYTVSGKTPQIQGVKADILVPSLFARETMGEEHLDYPLNPDIIPASYEDTLADIPLNLKPWYMRYYTPTIQGKKLFWDNMLPELKRDSEERMHRNQIYQDFLIGKVNGRAADVENMQTAEAVSVMKDMIRLQILHRGTEPADATETVKK